MRMTDVHEKQARKTHEIVLNDQGTLSCIEDKSLDQLGCTNTLLRVKAEV